MSIVYIGIGTNIGDRIGNIDDALSAIAHLPTTNIVAVSDLYETSPWGYTEQDNFYNICIQINTELSPNAILGACLGIEAALGRERTFRYAPRIIDIDVLLYEGVHMNTEELTVPHPRIQDRGFVLVPLKDILPSLEFFGADYNSAFENCDKTGIENKKHIKQWIFE